MVKIYEDEHIEGFFRQDLDDIFIIAKSKPNGFVESVSICLFDEKDVLHCVCAADTNVPDQYYLRVPILNQTGEFTGFLERATKIAANGILIGQESNGFRIGTRGRHLFQVEILSAYREYTSPDITKALKEASQTLAILYHMIKPTTNYFVLSCRGDRNFDRNFACITIKSEIWGRKKREENYISIVPAAMGEQTFLRQAFIQRSNKYHLGNNIFSLALGSFLFFWFCSKLVFEDQYTTPINYFGIITGVYMVFLSMLAFAKQNLETREMAYQTCLGVLEARTQRNRALVNLASAIEEDQRNEGFEEAEERRDRLNLSLLKLRSQEDAPTRTSTTMILHPSSRQIVPVINEQKMRKKSKREKKAIAYYSNLSEIEESNIELSNGIQIYGEVNETNFTEVHLSANETQESEDTAL